jgi:hypothetical protein
MSFNTSNIQSDTYIANIEISAPKHNVGAVELTEASGELNINALAINTDVLNTDYLVSTISITTPLIVGDIGYPITVQNLKTVSLNSGAGTANQVLALDSSLDLVWKDDANTPQGLESVLTVSNDANNLGITNLQSLTVSSGAGSAGQVLTLDSSLNLVWKDGTAPIPNIFDVLTSGDNAGALSITNLNNCEAQILTTSQNGKNWSLNTNPLTQNLDVLTTGTGLINLSSNSMITTGQISAGLLIGKKPSYDYWVSPNGNNLDAVNNGGSLENPFLTIGACLNYVEGLTAVDNVYRTIHILNGSYSENLTINYKVYLQGEAITGQSASVGCSLNGNINVVITTNGTDMFNNGVFIQNLLISGKVENNSSANQMLTLENVYIYTPNDASGQGLLHAPTSTNSRLKLWNCQIISGGNTGISPLIEVSSVGQVSMNYCNLSAKGVQNCLLFSSSATCDSINNCKFENSNSATISAKAVVQITANVSGTYTFSNCAFVYSSSASKSANQNASGILNQNSSGNNTIISLYNSFFLAGTTRVDNYAIQDLNHATATQMVCLYFMSNALPNNAFAIHANNNVNKFQLEVVS